MRHHHYPHHPRVLDLIHHAVSHRKPRPPSYASVAFSAPVLLWSFLLAAIPGAGAAWLWQPLGPIVLIIVAVYLIDLFGRLGRREQQRQRR
jgi:hypothetical protein